MKIQTTAWLMLFSRLILFFGLQALFALGFYLAGSAAAWEQSTNWWPLIVVLTNLVCVALLIYLFRAEGQRYWDLFKLDRQHILRDVLTVLASFIIGGPLAILPNILLGNWLFGDSKITLDLFVRPLPMWAAWMGLILFPITQGLAELVTYFGFVKPQFARQGMNGLLALSLPALLLGLQHLAMPFLFDIRFILWRALMYIPFAFFCGLLLHWRPRLLPYLALIHVLMNMSFATMFLTVAY